MADLISAARIISDFAGSSFRSRRAELERKFVDTNRRTVKPLCSSNGVDDSLLSSALTLKRTASQINEIVHCVGVLLLLPYILQENETVQSLSLAAAGTGKGGKVPDLETNFRIAEFKFIHWREKGNSGREHSLFKDFYELAESVTKKDRYLYVVGKEKPEHFLQSRQAIKTVLSHNNKVWEDFRKCYGNRFTKVNEYYEYRKQNVKLEDIAKMAPHLQGLFSQMDELD